MSGARSGLVRFLNSLEIDSARKLLYKVRYEEFKWKFMPNNPSGVRVQRLPNGEKMLCDHFDNEAKWIGMFNGQELTGVSRILTRENKFGKLDVELYESSKKLSTLIRLKEPCIEIQRAAVLQQQRGKNFLPGHVRFILDFAKERKSNILTTSSVEYVRKRMEELEFECIDDNFLYGDKDELPSSLYFLSLHKFDDAYKKLKDLEIHRQTSGGEAK